MTPATFAGLFALVLVLFNIIGRICAWHKLRHIPGPRWAAWSRTWVARVILQARTPQVLEQVSAKYGPIARIGPDWIVLSDAAEVRRIWSVHSGYHRGRWYEGWRLDPNRDNILTASDNGHHHRVRLQVLPGYIPKAGVNIDVRERRVDAEIQNLIGLIERKYISTREQLNPMDIARVFPYFTQDATSSVGFSEPFGYLDHDDDFYQAIVSLEGMLPVCSVIGLSPLALRILQSGLLNPLLPKPTAPNGIGKLVGILNGIVAKRYGEKPVRHDDILQSFVDSKLTQSEVEAEALVLLLGGTDTTATTLRMTVFYLTTTPHAYRALQAEIDGAVGKVTRPIITDAEARSLRYLQGCIKESLRLWAPVSGLQPKSSDTDDFILGYKIPAGTNVTVSEWALMKDKTIFGADADVFNPMRWVDAEGTPQLKEMEATQGLAFASGTRWECVGRKLAYMELSKVLFELFYRYDMAMKDPLNPFKWLNYGQTVYEHMHVTITKRNGVV